MKALLKSDFIKNVLTLMTGSVIAQAVSIIASPVLTRLYSPDDFGILSLFISITGILILTTTWRYEFALLLPESQEEASQILGSVSVLTVIMSIIFEVIIIFWNEEIAAKLGNKELSSYLYLIPISLLLIGFYNIFSLWQTRLKKFKNIAIAKGTEAVSKSATNIGLGLLNFGTVGLICGTILGQVASALFLLLKFPKQKTIQIRRIDLDKLKSTLIRYKDFALFDATSSALDTVARNAPVFFLARFFETSAAGFYGLSMRLLGMPINMLGRSFSQVYLQKIAELHHAKQKITPIILKAAARLFLVIIFPVIALVFFAPPAFSLIFGPKWLIAGEYARVLSVAIGARFVVSPLASILIISENLKLNAILKIINFVLTITILYTYSDRSALTMLKVYSIYETTRYAVIFLILLKFADQQKPSNLLE